MHPVVAILRLVLQRQRVAFDLPVVVVVGSLETVGSSVVVGSSVDVGLSVVAAAFLVDFRNFGHYFGNFVVG